MSNKQRAIPALLTQLAVENSVLVIWAIGRSLSTTNILVPIDHWLNSSDTSQKLAASRLAGWLKPSAVLETNLKACLNEVDERISQAARESIEDHLTTAVKLFETCEGEAYSIFAGNDYVAVGVYVAAEKLGLQIGKDVFVVGFGDIPLAQTMPVPLSSVFQNSELVGYESAKLLYELITGDMEKPVHRILPVELRIRASSTG